MRDFFIKLNLDGFILPLRPLSGFRKLVEKNESPRRRLLQAFLAGIVLIQFYADLFHLGDVYPVGKVMSLSLVLGPVAGILIAFFGAFFVMAFGCIFDANHRPRPPARLWRAPLPLRFLWNRIFGKKKVKAALQSGFLSAYQNAWRKGLDFFNGLLQQISHGATPFGRLLTFVVRASGPILCAALVQLGQHILLDDTTFSATASSTGTVLLIVKGLLIAWSFLLWVPLTKAAFPLSWGKSILVASLAVVLSIGLVLLTMWAIFAVPLG